MKICRKCKILKDLPEYSKEKRSSDGKRAQCKSCLNYQYNFWAMNNKDKVLKNVQKYKKTIKGKASHNNHNAKRRFKTEATFISKMFKDEISKIYLKAAKLRENNIDVHVDHIIPINGRNISGLHVPWNLQVISAKENLTKNNSMPPEA